MEETDTYVSCQTAQGIEIQGYPLRFTRHSAAFEVFHPEPVLRISERLDPLKIVLQGRVVYAGRAVVSNLIQSGTTVVCEAGLEEVLPEAAGNGHAPAKEVRAEFEQFLADSKKNFQVKDSFKLVVADLQLLLLDLRHWLGRVELNLQSAPPEDRALRERELLEQLQPSVASTLGWLFEKLESAAGQIAEELRPAHRYYVKRQLHPLVLCAPFMYRTYAKPLGYAGDYEMVNMMTRPPYEGSSLFAKLLNACFLATAPVIAHQNRIVYLTGLLEQEISRAVRERRPARIFNLGCGPAMEIQGFLRSNTLAQHAEFTLLDFNEETIQYTGEMLNQIKTQHGRRTPVRMIKKSVAQLIKEALKPQAAAPAQSYDLVYCAGLFDYLPDEVCSRLMTVLYRLAAPGGLVAVTNVDPSNPSRNWMEYAVDWHLIYRDHRGLAAVLPPEAPAEARRIHADMSGVNVFAEIRKPEDA